MSTRKQKRITRARKSGAQGKRGSRGKSRRSRTGGASYGGPPPYESLDEVPADLRSRAEREKFPWIQAFVNQGCPRGKLRALARAYADLNNIDCDEIPPYKTVYHWVKRYELYGMLGLIDAVRSDAGTHPSMPQEAANLLRTFYLGRGEVCRTSGIKFLTDHLPHEKIPSYDVVRHWTAEFERRHAHVLAMSEGGITQYRAECEGSKHLGILPRGGSTLAIDSTVADIWIRVPSPTDALGWIPVRPALTVIECVGSRALLTFGLSLVAVNAHLMLGLYRRAILQEANWVGLVSVPTPKTVVTDAGSEHRGVMEEHLKWQGIHIQGRTPNKPKQNAQVERLIQTVQLEVFRHLPGYSKLEKPFEPYGPAEGDVKRSLRSLEYDPYRMEVLPENLLTLREVEARILGWAKHYNMRPHPSLSPALPEVRAALARAEIHRTAA